MSWLFSQALVAEYSAATCSDGEPSAQLNVMPTPHKFWHKDKTIRGRRWVEMARQFRRMDDGLAFAVERTEAIGNGQVPIVAATAFDLLSL